MGKPASQHYTQSYKYTVILLFVSEWSVVTYSKFSLKQPQFSSLLIVN